MTKLFEPSDTSGPSDQLSQRLLEWVDAHRRTLFIALLGLYLLGFNGQWRIEPDSGLYLSVGRSLARGEGYTYHGQPHRLAYPGLPWLFATMFRIFGDRSLLPAHVLMLLSGLAALALNYRLFLLHAGRPVAVLVALGLGISRTFYRYCFELLSDMPFLMGVSAFLAGCEAIFQARGRARWYDYVLLVGGLGTIMVMRPTRYAMLLAIAAAGAWALLRRPIRWGRLTFGVLAVGIAVAGVALNPRREGQKETIGDYEDPIFYAFTEQLRPTLDRALTENLPALLNPGAGEALFGLDFGHVDLGAFKLSVNPIPSLFALAFGLMLFRRRPLWGFWIISTLLMMLAVLVHVRYFLQVLPLLVYGWWAGANSLARRASRRWSGVLLIALLVAFGGLNLARVGKFIVEQRQRPMLEAYKGGRYASVNALAELIRERTPTDAWILVPRKFGRVMTFASGRCVVEPDAVTNVNPASQPVYVVMPMDELGLDWMERGHHRLGIGEPVGPAILAGKRGHAWQLHRVVPAGPGMGGKVVGSTSGAVTP